MSNDWMRSGYKRSDFSTLVRGKYAKRIQESTNVIVLDPQVAEVFPNDKAVNDALRELIARSPSSSAASRRKKKSSE